MNIFAMTEDEKKKEVTETLESVGMKILIEEEILPMIQAAKDGLLSKNSTREDDIYNKGIIAFGMALLDRLIEKKTE